MIAKYLVYFCNDFGAVFESQVIELIISLNEKKSYKKIYLFLGIMNDLERLELQKKKIPEEIEIIFYKSYPNYVFFNLLLREKILLALKNNNIILEESIYHTRDPILAWHISKIIDKKYFNRILPDIRGANVEEVKEFYSLTCFQRYFKLLNYKKAFRSLLKFKKISAVTESLKRYLVKNYKINPDNIVVTPCLAAKYFKFDIIQRKQMRKDINLSENDILIVFSSGGNANWQNNSALKILADKGMKILNLSKKEIQHNNVINKFVKFNDVPLYLNAADIGIIWRDKSIVNEVASPVKFSEYICCGLPVISNNSVTMISNYIKRTGFGLLLSDLYELDHEKLKLLKSLNRQEIADKGIKWLGIDNIRETYLSTYISLKNFQN